MINILLNGCNGKMGQVISRLCLEYEGLKIAAGYDLITEQNFGYPVYNNYNSIKEDIDVVIDFSHPDALNNVLEYCVNKNLPIIMATTGLSIKQQNTLKETAYKIPVFFSANMSLGINLLISISKKVAPTLFGNFDIEIIEKHHNQKIDAPSGTALAIADNINETLGNKLNYVYDRHSVRKKRNTNEVGIHAVRGGNITGDHTVLFAGKDEIIEFHHQAMSKDIFGTGALNAAMFIKDKSPGFYCMEDLFKDIL